MTRLPGPDTPLSMSMADIEELTRENRHLIEQNRQLTALLFRADDLLERLLRLMEEPADE